MFEILGEKRSMNEIKRKGFFFISEAKTRNFQISFQNKKALLNIRRNWDRLG